MPYSKVTHACRLKIKLGGGGHGVPPLQTLWFLLMIKPLALFILAVVVALILNQCRKPRWFPGRLLLWNMNQRHSALTDWGLEHAPVATSRAILDVGCGGGMTVRKLCKSSGDSKVFGIDLSSTSVNSSRKLNADLIKAGRVEIEQSGVSSLSFPDGTVDLITAVETHYYWPNLSNDLQEIHRVLKPGGYFLIIAETYKGCETI